MYSTRYQALALVLVVPAVAAAQEKIDNPEFASWSKFKKGTGVTLKSTTEFNKTSNETLITFTLVEVGADKLVIETTSVAKFNGMEIKVPPMKRDVTKTIELPKGAKKEDFAAGKPAGTTEEGTETLKVGGVEVKTKCTSTKPTWTERRPKQRCGSPTTCPDDGEERNEFDRQVRFDDENGSDGIQEAVTGRKLVKAKRPVHRPAFLLSHSDLQHACAVAERPYWRPCGRRAAR